MKRSTRRCAPSTSQTPFDVHVGDVEDLPVGRELHVLRRRARSAAQSTPSTRSRAMSTFSIWPENSQLTIA